MYTNDREAYRHAFINAWRKYQEKIPLESFEGDIVDILLLHPNYQVVLEKFRDISHQEFHTEENPFLHMSLHLAIREQIRMDKPAGMSSIFDNLIKSGNFNPHDAEHQMMQCLANMMWMMQQNGEPPSEEAYLEKLREIKI